jgi:hypothetical protein
MSGDNPFHLFNAFNRRTGLLIDAIVNSLLIDPYASRTYDPLADDHVAIDRD